MGFMRKFFIVVLIVSLVLSVSAVVAEDNITDDLSGDCDLETVSEDDSPIGESETPVLTSGDDFDSVQNMIDSAKAGDTIYLEGKTFKGNGKTIMVNKSMTIVGGFGDGDNVNATFDGQNKSRIMTISASDVTLKGIRFVNGNAIPSEDLFARCGGALFVEDDMNVSVEGCAFINNSANNWGGAMYGYDCSVVGCVFENNSAWSAAGAMNGGSAVDCVFVGNSADCGGAMGGGSAMNCVFVGNSANQGGAIGMGSAVDCVFVGNSANQGGAMFYPLSAVNCVFVNNTASTAGVIFKGNPVNCVFVNNSANNGYDTIVLGSADSCIFKNNSYEEVNILNPSLTVFNYASSYNSSGRLKFNLAANNGMEITNRNITVEIYKNNVLVGTYECLSGEGLPVDLDVGSYVAVCRANEYNINPVNATLTIWSPTKITASSIKATYNSNKYLVVDLRDAQGNPVEGVTVSVDLGGVRNLLTDSNGQVKVSTNKLAPGTYTAKIIFEGNDNYVKSSGEVKVTVNKLKSTITAKKKTLKKVRKYTITLKSGKKPIKKAKVILKIKKKTFKAKTNKNGKATFKIKKMNKGKYKATITYKGNYLYKKATKKITLKVK